MQTFIQFLERNFTQRRSDSLMGTTHKERQDYLGWEIWFWNREGKGHEENKDAFEFHDWIHEDGKVNDYFREELEKYWSENPKKLKAIEEGIEVSQDIHSMNEEGWEYDFLAREFRELFKILAQNMPALTAKDESRNDYDGKDTEKPIMQKIHRRFIQLGLEEGEASKLLYALQRKGPTISAYVTSKNDPQEEINKEFHTYMRNLGSNLKTFLDGSRAIGNALSVVKTAVHVLFNKVMSRLASQHKGGVEYQIDVRSVNLPKSDMDFVEVFRYFNNKDNLIYYFSEVFLSHVDSKRDDRHGAYYYEGGFEKFKQKAMTLVKKIANVLQSLNLRKFHKVPIVFAYQGWGEPSGFGDVNKYGHASHDHIMVFTKGYENDVELLKLIAHEVGHIVFAKLSTQEQQEILALANSGAGVSNYGRTDYVYSGMRSPVIHHTSGNEFFATMLEYFATNYEMYANRIPKLEDFAKLKDFTLPKNKAELTKHLEAIKKFKGILAGATNTKNPMKKYSDTPVKIRPPRRLQKRKMPKFTEWLQDRPAIVRSVHSEDRKGLKKACSFVRDALIKLLTGFGVNESYSREKYRYEPVLFPTTCAHVCKFLMKNGVDIKKGVPPHACGTEGCAYFYGDKVLKCTLGKAEWTVASRLKGEADIVPVIDTDVEPITKVYLILSWKLDTDKAMNLEYQIREAASLIHGWFDEGRVRNIQPTDRRAVNALTDVEAFKSILQDLQSREIAEIAERLFELVVEIYRKSEYLVGSDIHAGNLGYTKDDKMQMFDLGYPDQIGKSREMDLSSNSFEIDGSEFHTGDAVKIGDRVATLYGKASDGQPVVSFDNKPLVRLARGEYDGIRKLFRKDQRVAHKTKRLKGTVTNDDRNGFYVKMDGTDYGVAVNDPQNWRIV